AASTAVRPSVFDLLAADQLSSLLQPAFDHLLTSVASRLTTANNDNEDQPTDASSRPRILILHRLADWLVRHRRVAFALLSICVEIYCLRRRGATFAENFYSLRRRRVADGGVALTARLVVMSLFTSTVVPMVTRWLSELYEEWAERSIVEESDSDTLGSTIRKQFLTCLVKVYPRARAVLLLSNAALLFGYLTERVDRHRLEHVLAGVRLSCQIDHPIDEEANGRVGLRYWASQALSHGVTLGMFFLQFYQSRVDSDGHSSSASAAAAAPSPYLGAVSIPPPPRRHPASDHVDPRLCPMCKRPRRNPCALTTSGHVFCFACIHSHLAGNGSAGKCPVTGVPSSIRHIVRLL
ncbi:hypothetical protein BOX15_Mlig029688g5, partial [Macrostomum lignano]